MYCFGPDEEGYERKLRTDFGPDMMKNVEFTGLLEGDDVYKAYRAMDLFALTSYSENFGMTVVEAGLCRIPILITKQVGVSCFFNDGETAFIVDPDEDKICSVIKKHYLDESRAERMVMQADSLVREKFNVLNNVEDLALIFNTIVEDG